MPIILTKIESNQLCMIFYFKCCFQPYPLHSMLASINCLPMAITPIHSICSRCRSLPRSAWNQQGFPQLYSELYMIRNGKIDDSPIVNPHPHWANILISHIKPGYPSSFLSCCPLVTNSTRNQNHMYSHYSKRPYFVPKSQFMAGNWKTTTRVT